VTHAKPVPSKAGAPASSAFIHIDNADGTVFLELDEADTLPNNPVVLLRQKFNDRREANPCDCAASKSKSSKGKKRFRGGKSRSYGIAVKGCRSKASKASTCEMKANKKGFKQGGSRAF